MAILKFFKTVNSLKVKKEQLKQLEDQYIELHTQWGLDVSKAISTNDKKFLKHKYVFLKKQTDNLNLKHFKISDEIYKENLSLQELLKSSSLKNFIKLSKIYNDFFFVIITGTLLLNLILIYLYFQV